MQFEHIPNVKVQATFSADCKLRYLLVISKRDTAKGKTICAIMENPSAANEEVADKSVQFLERLVFLESYPEFKNVDRLIIVNQFAFIQTRGFVGADKRIGSKNDFYIEQAIRKSDIILVAWGKSNRHRRRQEAINRIISSYQGKALYQTKVHPSRGSLKDFIKPYSI
jgi:hypothetical protein